MRDPLPTAGERRLKSSEEEKPGSPLKRGAVRDDDDESAGDEESGEHIRGEWRTLGRSGAAKDGGHRRSSAQERNLTPRTKPNAHRDVHFNNLQSVNLFPGKKEYCK